MRAAFTSLYVGCFMLAVGCGGLEDGLDTEREAAGTQAPPLLSALWKSYPVPGDSSDKIFRIIFCKEGEHSTAACDKTVASYKSWISNTCTLRISRAFNYAGHKVPFGYTFLSQESDDNGKLDTTSGSDGKNYAFRVNEFSHYLRDKLVAGEVCTENCAAQFKGKIGVITFDFGYNPDAPYTGHFDLFNGTSCRRACYFDGIQKAILWSTPDACDSVERGRPSWGAEGEGSPTTTLTFDDQLFVEGSTALKAETNAAYDWSLVYPAARNARFALEAAGTLKLQVAARNTNVFGWQGSSPVVVLEDSSGARMTYTPTEYLLPTAGPTADGTGWKALAIPLAGSSSWTRSGSAALGSIRAIEIHADTWGGGFTLWVDGLSYQPPTGKCQAL